MIFGLFPNRFPGKDFVYIVQFTGKIETAQIILSQKEKKSDHSSLSQHECLI